MKPGVFLAALCAALFLRTGEAQAHVMQCGDRERMIASLEAKYQERRAAFGVANNGGLVELFATSDGLTWTLIRTQPGLPTCIIAAGQAWKTVKQKVEGEES